LFGYLKKYPNQRLVLNSNSLLVDEELQQSSFHPDFLDDYDGAKEEIGTGFPDPYMVVMNWNLQYFLMPTSHAHHHLMRRSITGIMVFVGSTPVLWPSKHQGCIATSTYTAKFVGASYAALCCRGGNFNSIYVALLGSSCYKTNQSLW
jgi:hypothetical protein